MNDRALLEAAAKAAGIEHPGGSHSIYNDGRLWDCKALRWWNPLTDDGDALRLACALKLNIMQGDFSIGVNDEADIDEADFVRDESERAATLRRAIVRAAATLAGADGGSE